MTVSLMSNPTYVKEPIHISILFVLVRNSMDLLRRLLENAIRRAYILSSIMMKTKCMKDILLIYKFHMPYFF